MTLSAVSTVALFITAALYAVIGAAFAARRDYRSASALYVIAFLAFLGALA